MKVTNKTSIMLFVLVVFTFINGCAKHVTEVFLMLPERRETTVELKERSKQPQLVPKIQAESFNPYQVLFVLNQSNLFCELPMADEGLASENYFLPPKSSIGFRSITNTATKSSLGWARVTIFCYGKPNKEDFIGERTFEIKIDGQVKYSLEGEPVGQVIFISSCCFRKDWRGPIRVKKFLRQGIFFVPLLPIDPNQ